jgi:hypothetical protein
MQTQFCKPMQHPVDHAVILVHCSKQKARSFYESCGFIVSEGGTHAGGLTSNLLIIFRDGSYVELLFFSEPPSVDKHNRTAIERRFAPRWRPPPPFSLLIDFAVRGEPSLASSSLVAAEPGQRGGASWRMWFPEDNGPFFIEDVTDRALRVPSDSELANSGGVVRVDLAEGRVWLEGGVAFPMIGDDA